jgi:uncharacterized repeat protein (TIGR03809 family)
MTERPTLRRLGEVAQKWRDLAELRRRHLEDLYRSGRWKLYYTEETLLARMREIVATIERWEKLIPGPRPETDRQAQEAEAAPAPPRERHAA